MRIEIGLEIKMGVGMGMSVKIETGGKMEVR